MESLPQILLGFGVFWLALATVVIVSALVFVAYIGRRMLRTIDQFDEQW